MCRKVLISLILLLLPAFMVMAADTAPAEDQKEPGAKELSGMSIVGNDEAPKSLYIVPWKSSELGVATSLNMLLNGNQKPVDKEVFLRHMGYYNISAENASVNPFEMARKN